MTMDTKRTIILTGYGPFGKHTINASWEAVKFISSEYCRTGILADFNLIIEELPVDYNHVASRIPQLWKIYDPVFVIHVGVSSIAECITIESRAHSKGYIREDINNTCPDESNVEENNLILETVCDVKQICNYINNIENSNIKASVSHDAGRYLCEYVYYQSLKINQNRTLFVHVPDLNIYPTAQTASGLYNVLRHILEFKNI
ncbi:pyroglutamyl-peptidase 1 [Cephus cinctus]|uniref:Pyroglutamyl-peptidase 1 n=1 Tax=Cephus cinctus TaxID=211228 RepID=A0AAJ7FQT7_CEPCN|nr:pyroglutamyl-peptidase 1 [Cephus cinctus]XP_015603709.1 pyroglutamyl-peptidase 1 [Cephus cinctus]